MSFPTMLIARSAAGVLLIGAVILAAMNFGARPAEIGAKAGLVDYSSTLLPAEPTPIGGKWAYYQGLIDPALLETAGAGPDPEFVVLPHHWRGNGAGTYAITLQLPDKASGPHAVLVPEPLSAHSIYVNGRLAGGAGRVAETAAGERARAHSTMAVLPETSRVTLVIQVSNHINAYGGLREAPEFGSLAAIAGAAERETLLPLLMLGATVALAFYLALFLTRGRPDFALLVLICLGGMIGIRTIFADDLIFLALPSMEQGWIWRLEYAASFFTLALLAHFLAASFPDRHLQRVTHGLYAISSAATAAALFTPVAFTNILGEYYYYVALLGVFYLTARVTVFAWHRREGALIALLGLVCLAASGTVAAFPSPPIGDTGDLLTYGLFFYLVLQSAFLASRFHRAHLEAEHLSGKLASTNQALENEVAERKKTEKHLVESETFYRALLDNAHDATSVVMPSGEIRYISPAGERLLSRMRKNERGYVSVFELVHPDDVQNVHDTISKVLAAPDESHQTRLRLGAGDGSWRTVEVVCRRFQLRSGETAIIVNNRDVTGQELATVALREREAQIRLITNNLPLMIVCLDQDERILFMNRTALSWYAISEEEVVGKSVYDLVPEERHEVLIRAAQAAWRGEMPRLSQRATYPDGVTRLVEVSMVPHRSDSGEIVGLFGMAMDVSERENAIEALRDREEQLRLVTDNLPVLIAYVDKDLRVRMANQTALDWHGIKREQTIGEDFSKYMSKERLKSVEDALMKALSGERQELVQTVTFGDGKTRTVEITLVPHIGRGDSIEGVVWMSLDITERLEIESQLRQSQKMEALGQLTGGIAHDFNNLLSVILGNLELAIEEAQPTDEFDEMLQTAANAARRGADLTHRLLAFSRKQPLNPEIVDLNTLIGGLNPMLTRTLGEGVDVVLDLADDLGLIRADRAQIETAVLNLALNARDAMIAGGRLTIRTENVERGGGHESDPDDDGHGQVAIIAEDTGVGMTPDVAAHAFEPFFTTKEQGQGTGLGLSMIYGFLQQSGGGVSLESEPDNGTTITLYFPRYDPPCGPVPPRDKPETTQDGSRQGKTVLVVEDDPDLLTLVERIVTGLGYQALATSDPNLALDYLKSIPSIDVLFTDIVLPNGLNGYELARAASSIRPGIKILFTSGYSDVALPGRDGDYDGMEPDLIVKPYRRETIARALERAIDVSH